ncbi:hypothetical protein G9A89_011231 [Geosiphon pyriformis]|nr:hypothetical protein G9A89_011231 [Geosiphon pyriformis]
MSLPAQKTFDKTLPKKSLYDARVLVMSTKKKFTGFNDNTTGKLRGCQGIQLTAYRSIVLCSNNLPKTLFELANSTKLAKEFLACNCLKILRPYNSRYEMASLGKSLGKLVLSFKSFFSSLSYFSQTFTERNCLLETVFLRTKLTKNFTSNWALVRLGFERPSVDKKIPNTAAFGALKTGGASKTSSALKTVALSIDKVTLN